MSEELQQAITRYLDSRVLIDNGLAAIIILGALIFLALIIFGCCDHGIHDSKKDFEKFLQRRHNDEITQQILETNKDRIEEYKKKGIM